MAKIVKVHYDYTRQPQAGGRVDYRNPLSRGLLLAVTPGSSRITSPCPSVPTPFGKGFGGSNTMGRYDKYPFRDGFLNSSAFYKLYFTAAPAWNANTNYFSDTGSQWPEDKGLKINSVKSYGRISLGARDTGGNFRNVELSPGDGNIAAGESRSYGFTVDGNSGIRYYNKAGRPVGTDTTLAGVSYLIPGADKLPAIFGISDITANGDPGTYIICLFRWNRILSDAEMLDVYQNPWTVFRTPERRILLTDAGSWFLLQKKNKLAYPNQF